jgi:hypothetical protein
MGLLSRGSGVRIPSGALTYGFPFSRVPVSVPPRPQELSRRAASVGAVRCARPVSTETSDEGAKSAVTSSRSWPLLSSATATHGQWMPTTSGSDGGPARWGRARKRRKGRRRRNGAEAPRHQAMPGAATSTGQLLQLTCRCSQLRLLSVCRGDTCASSWNNGRMAFVSA